MNRHARLIKLGLDTNAIHATRLVNDYSLRHAHQVFDQVLHRDTTLWTALISAYVQSGPSHCSHAIRLFSIMAREQGLDSRPNHFTVTTVARAVASAPEHLYMGKSLHGYVIKSGMMSRNVVVETAFTDMYAKCGDVDSAHKLFDEMNSRNLVTWNAMVAGFVQNGLEKIALELFVRMKCLENYFPDECTISTALLGVANIQDLIFGLQIHGYAIVSGLDSNCLNSIAHMYFCCGQVNQAEKLFGGVEGDIASKMIKIRGFVYNQRYCEVLKQFCLDKNPAEIFNWDYTIILPILTACTKLSLLRVGKQVHSIFITLFGSCFHSKFSEDDNVILGSAFIDLYSKCSVIDDAQKVFDHWMPERRVSHWNVLIFGYIYNDLIEDARRLFDDMPVKNVVSWTSMMTGYAQNGRPQEVLKLLDKMYSDEEGFKVEGNCLTFVVGLESISLLSEIEKGKQVHAKIIRRFISADTCNVIVGTALVDMYSKSGNMKYAKTVFDKMVEKNTIAWTSIITGYSVHGLGFHALKLFQQMMEKGIQPNEVTFIAVLTACSRCGLVEEGLHYFELMKTKYNLMPREDHFTCLMDMLGRLGKLDEAWRLLEEIEDTELGERFPSGTILAALLGNCHVHGNVEIGKKVAKKMLQHGKQVSTTHITLSNVYSSAGMWNEAFGVRMNWKKDGDENAEPGLSRICTHPQVY
ncbi:pentatricopeptide repeat-containing At2g13600-like isoform X1 [Olea europaea subsp. europaea]|uniref:Pentatricopeptide repeat-containing At2g13600-like isoform X1 n=1 Tax=Olea europaea subsp. europaea TaxID=158383 RepID=A0A8S0Q1F0_OLEEU|nr:pentatricopeptide repeat-containing At2g13600-like isoform X1 [Olea europaea subsp. europaea]